MLTTALSIAGSDPSSGAGLQADLRTFHALGVYGLGIITSITVQNTTGVFGRFDLEPELVYSQIDKLFEDIRIDGVKIGMLGNGRVVSAVVRALRGKDVKHIVLDTPLFSKNGHPLLDREGIAVLKNELIPLSSLITPNLPEAEALSGVSISSAKDMVKAAYVLKDMGADSVLIKGGHLGSGKAVDLLLWAGEVYEFVSERLPFQVRGTGCVFASAITSFLVKGLELPSAVGRAKDFITESIKNSRAVGRGYRVMPLKC